MLITSRSHQYFIIFYHFQQLENRAIIAIDAQYKAMFDVSRILAIPDNNPDHRQMGISAANHRALVQDRGGVKVDGTKAKASLLKKDFSKSYQKAGFIKGDKPMSMAKGDRKLTPEIAAKAKKAIAKTKDANPLSKQIAKIGVADLIRKQEKETQPFWDRINDGEELSPSDVAKYQKIDARQTKERIEAKEKVKSLLIKNGEDQMGVDIISANLGNQASEWDRLVKLAAKDEIKSRKVIKGKSPRDRQSQSTNTAIAPDTAKKIKRAIPLGSSVKGGKVVKGQKPVSGRVIESGKAGKDGFTKVTATIPLRAYRTKSGVQQSEPMKGEKIGDYFVSGDTRLGYDVTHLPSGSLLLNTSTLKKELGGSDRKTAKLAAQKLYEARVKMPSTYNRVKSLNQKDLMDLQKKVFDSIK